MIEKFARFDSLIRKSVVKLPGLLPVRIYSPGRKYFIKLLSKHKPHNSIKLDKKYEKTLWGIKFSSPLFNAAGMFKLGEAYYAIAAQGAGAFLAGTTTSFPRKGNSKNCILHPFLPLPKSSTAINWMGLPNKGHLYTATQLSKYKKIDGCPIGASISPNPLEINLFAATGLVEGLFIYENAGVDFIEINESCPNVPHEKICSADALDPLLLERLQFIHDNYIQKRNRFYPIIIKFSNDTQLEMVPKLVTTLLELGFDGINFGNTSTNYTYFETFMNNSDKKKFKKFYSSFGGGASGYPLKKTSLLLASEAVKVVREINPSREFNVIRTGGIENYADILQSENSGIALNQWFTGYFDEFSLYGSKVYKNIFE